MVNKYLLMCFVMLGLAAGECFPGEQGLSIKDILLKQKLDYFDVEKSKYTEEGLSEGLFRVRIFDGLIYLPNRFVLISSSKESHHFNSFPLDSGIQINGSIMIGDYKDFAPSTKSQLIRSYVDHKTGLNVLLYEYVSGPRDGGRRLNSVLHDGEQYISIVDENEKLWELIFSKYEKG